MDHQREKTRQHLCKQQSSSNNVKSSKHLYSWSYGVVQTNPDLSTCWTTLPRPKKTCTPPLIPGFAASSRVFLTQFDFMLLNLCFPPHKTSLDLTLETQENPKYLISAVLMPIRVDHKYILDLNLRPLQVRNHMGDLFLTVQWKKYKILKLLCISHLKAYPSFTHKIA